MKSVFRIHITGASGSGVTTLGALISKRYNIPYFDVDSFFWMPTDPPFTTKRSKEDRIRSMREEMSKAIGWIIGGSCIGWGDELIQEADLIVFLTLKSSERMARIDKREDQRFGARIKSGGDMHSAHCAFREWALLYDDPEFDGRSLKQHKSWLESRASKVICLDSSMEPNKLVEIIEAQINPIR